MNDEQSKRLADAANAALQAADAVREARTTLSDPRFDADQERDRTQAVQQMASRIDNAAKKLDDALHKGAVAAAALGRPGVFGRYQEAAEAVREGQELGRSAPNQDGTAAKKAQGEAACVRLEEALETLAVVVFGEEPG